MSNQKEKHVLITGATGGIGQALARKLAPQYDHIHLHYHTNEKMAHKLKNELERNDHVTCSIYACDLSKQGEVQNLIEALPTPPDVLIHNAAIPQYGLFTQISMDEYERMIQLHLTSTFALTQYATDHMIKHKWGKVVFITSIWGEIGASCESVYAMVKGGMHSFMKSIAKELAPSNITVNAVSPGAIDTEMLSGYTKEELNDLCQQIPIGRLGTPDEVAHTVQFILQEDSRYITGQILRVNGGWLT